MSFRFPSFAQPFVHGREVQYKGWIGIITKVRRHVTCRLDNGGFIFSLKSNEADSFMKKDPFWGNPFPTFPKIAPKLSLTLLWF